MQNADESDYKKIGELLEDFFIKYAEKDLSVTDEEFLKEMFADKFPKMSEKKIDAMCREIFDSNKYMEDFLQEIKTSPGYENVTQDWFREKIKSSMNNGDYELIQRFCLQNEILDMINHSVIQFSNGFQNIGLIQPHDKNDFSSTTENIFKQGHAEKKITPANVHQAAFDTGVKKSIMTQYKRIMQLDFSAITVRTDISTVAANLSRNAALTGVCGMALTTGLSILFKNSVLKQNFTKFLIKTGTTDSLRVIVTGALKVGAERRILPLLTRATPMLTLTAVALIAVESSKTILQYANGEIKCLEALNQVSKVSTSAICSVIFGLQGALFGATAVATVPIASPLVGAFMGELVGTMAGYEIGRISYAKLKTLLMNTQSILTANYGILDALTNKAVVLTNKRKNELKIF